MDRGFLPVLSAVKKKASKDHWIMPFCFHSSRKATLERSLLLLGAMLALMPVEGAWAQHGGPAKGVSAATSPTAARDKTAPQQSVLTLKKQVNLVLVPVVVRDKKGKSIGSLTRDDFRIFDNGKPQPISSFNREANPVAGERAQGGQVLANALLKTMEVSRPSHFFAYLFDDVHMQAGELMRVREAAKKHLASDMGRGDRAAVYTTSGNVELEFTGDLAQLDHALDRIKPKFNDSRQKCPYMNYYLAQQIMRENGSDLTPVWDAATDDTWYCLFHKAPNLQPRARQLALDAARQAVEVGDTDTRTSMLAIQQVVRRLAAMPGSRTLVLVSPGFQTGDDYLEQDVAIDLATKQDIVINALDARGLYTGIHEAEDYGPSTLQATQTEAPYNRQGRILQSGVMAELADGTGGKLFRDNNDLAGGFDQLGSPPEYVYVLGFSPAELKKAGSYHTLKVVVARRHGWTVQARPGYYATTGAQAPEKMLSTELEQVLFSHDEVKSIPVTLTEGYSKQGGGSRKLLVITHIDLSGVHFKKVNQANVDNLILVCGLFDINGNYLEGKKKNLSLHFASDVLNRITEGMNVKTTFDVKPGAYLIRVVVRDSGDGLVSAVNGSGFIE